MRLKDKKRKGVGTMFRHQVETFTILFEYGYTDAVLLKASFIHDLLEEEPELFDEISELISKIDQDSSEVLQLVKEMSIKLTDGLKEPKSRYLLRIMKEGNQRVKLLKLADRISNVASLTVINNVEFIKRYLKETEEFILPYANKIDSRMAIELRELIELKSRLLQE